MRSLQEIQFRLNQERKNLLLFLLPPSFTAPIGSPLARLAEPRSTASNLQNTSFATNLLCIADEICQHRFVIFDSLLEIGNTIDWCRDHQNSISSPRKYFRLIPYLDRARVGDHKNIWEINRHQHLVLLGQAYLLSNSPKYLKEIETQLEAWLTQNPYQSSINWTSSLEVAFRAFSWIWIYHFVANDFTPSFRSRFLNSLYQHGFHLETNLSYYFSPNTHLLGEAVVLHALGKLFPSFPNARRWVDLGNRIVVEQIKKQVRRDGSHFEQSTYYHVYALDMFVFHAIISEPASEYLETLHSMSVFLQNLLGSARTLHFLGDDDGGRFFHPYGERSQFGRATLATCSLFLKSRQLDFQTDDLFPQAAWWLGITNGSAKPQASSSKLFPESGLAILQSGPNQLILDAGPFGPGSSGHSHSDSLSVVASAGDNKLLIDPGTFTYVGSEEWRNKFRGSSAHSTLRVNESDQAFPSGPFRWSNQPTVKVVDWKSNELFDSITAQCTYSNLVHKRYVHYLKPNLIFILDRLDGPAGVRECLIEQFWHLGSKHAERHLFLGSPATAYDCWHSSVFSEKHPASCLVVRRLTQLPALFASALVFYSDASCTVSESDAAVFEFDDDITSGRFEFPWPQPGPNPISASD